jgi:hypothetical protein
LKRLVQFRESNPHFSENWPGLTFCDKFFRTSQEMKKIINICLLLTFLVGYLEWGKDHSAFIFQSEAEIFLKARNNFVSFLHPLILIPLCGQIIILYTIFQQKTSRILSLLGLACLSTIMLLLFFIGLITLNIKIAGSTLPFIITGVFVLRYNWKRIPKD